MDHEDFADVDSRAACILSNIASCQDISHTINDLDIDTLQTSTIDPSDLSLHGEILVSTDATFQGPLLLFDPLQALADTVPLPFRWPSTIDTTDPQSRG